MEGILSIDEQPFLGLLGPATSGSSMDHVLDLCEGLTLPQLDILQRQIRDRRNARSGFMRLPGEIRNKIYELVIESEMLQPAAMTYLDLAGLKKLLVGVSGFNICRQIRSEFRSFLEPEHIQICRYNESDTAFVPVDLFTFGESVRGAHWFRALGCDDLQVAQKSVRLCDDEIGADCCGTITFGPALGLRPMFFAVDLPRPSKKRATTRRVRPGTC